jgi:hypothetical protein
MYVTDNVDIIKDGNMCGKHLIINTLCNFKEERKYKEKERK